MSKTFYEIHFTGEGFRSLATYRLFFKAALRRALKVRADYEAEVAEWYETGDGAQPNWVTEVDDDGTVRQYNEGGRGYTFPHCIHGSSRWTDYDNICGWCEDSSTAIEEAIVAAREGFLRFNARWEWLQAAPGDLPIETRRDIERWTLSTFPGQEA